MKRSREDVDRQLGELKSAVTDLALLSLRVKTMTEVIAEQLAPPSDPERP